MTYDEFKTFLITFLWKKGDQQVIDNLDTLIHMANNEIERRLPISMREASAVINVTQIVMDTPADYKNFRSLTDMTNGMGQLRYVEPANLYQTLAFTNGSVWKPIFSLINNQMLFCGPVQNNFFFEGPTPPVNPVEGMLWFRTTVSPGLYVWVVDANSSQWVQLSAEQAASSQATLGTMQVLLDYERKIPDFKTTDTSWLADDYLDLYTYGTLIHSAGFIREDERLPNWGQLFEKAIETATEDSEFNKRRGVYASKPLPRQAGINRRKRGVPVR